jgi:hypothetical protein
MRSSSVPVVHVYYPVGSAWLAGVEGSNSELSKVESVLWLLAKTVVQLIAIGRISWSLWRLFSKEPASLHEVH